jgi:dihydrofolate reductase
MQEAGDVEEIMIMGGAGLYEQMLENANRLHLTEVHAEVAGDVYFPEIDSSEWKELEREAHSADEKNEFDYSFVVMERIG